MSTPRVTVLMPAYNAARYIGEAIASVLCQTFTDFELLIVNDGSSDDTENVVRSFTDSRIVLVSQSNGGVSKALNLGLKLAKGEYIARFDADDICLPHRLQKQVELLDAHPGYVLAGSDAEYILENGNHLFHFTCIGHSSEEILKKLYFYCPIIHSSVMYRKGPVVDAGGYCEYAHSFEDYLLWVQLAKTGKLCNLPEPLVKVRFNPASLTIDEKWRGSRFRKLKRGIINRGIATAEESHELAAILKSQDNRKIKEGAYHALCAKKFLVNNYRPSMAREHLRKAISLRPGRLDNYLLYAVSYLPAFLINWLHSQNFNRG